MDENNVTEKVCWGNCLPGEEIVITGISGAFPRSNNVHELRDNLFKKADMVQSSKRRWNSDHPEIPPRLGTLPEIDKYDAGYFGVHERQSHSLDAQYRILQEKVLESIFDAGLHPSDLENTRTGVFIGISTCESAQPWLQSQLPQSYAMTGFPYSMAAHRLSYFLKLRGPSCAIEAACSSSLHAVEHGFKAIRLGEVDSAIVGGTNLCLFPLYSLQLARLGVLGKDACCKVFDNAANGYVRAEAIVVIFLQKSKDAKRIYAQVVHAKSNCNGYTGQGITFPSREGQKSLYKEFYMECGVDQHSLSFVEAHGTGTVAGDPQECEGIDDVLTKKRTTPLLIGSVKSNFGHGEPASGLCGVIKCIIGMEEGLIPPNRHYTTLRAEIKGLAEGRLKVVTDAMPLADDRDVLMAINNFGFGGANCHILLRRNPKKKVNNGLPSDNLDRLVCVSGRTEEAVTNLLDNVSTNELDVEHIRLLHDVFRKAIPNHLYRGYAIMSKTGEVSRSNKFYSQPCKPLHFVFGELHNWWDIGNYLMALPTFADSVKRIDEYISNNGINISSILLNIAPTQDFNSVLGNIAVQVAVINVLNLLEIKATTSSGYSVGTLLSAYYEGDINLEETIRCALVLDNFVKKHSHKAVNELNGFTSHLKHFRITLKGNTLREIRELESQLMEILDTFKSSSNAALITKRRSAKCIVNAITNNQSTEHNALNSVILKIGETNLRDDTENGTFLFANSETKNYLEEFLNVVGDLYVHGFNPQVSKLYPSVDLPVSRGTRMISPYIKWKHDRNFFVPHYNTEEKIQTQDGCRTVTVQLADDHWSYIEGHVVDGRNLFPATGYLYLVWETYKIMNETEADMSIILEDCKFSRATLVPKEGHITFNITIQKGSGRFEVVEGQSTVVTGRIYATDDEDEVCCYQFINWSKTFSLPLKNEEIYKELRLRGYYYKDAFCAIQECDNHCTKACIKWDNNWVTFLDNMLQMKILELDSRLLLVPTYISKVFINSRQHIEWINTEYINAGKTPIIPVINDHMTGTLRCGGIHISGLIVSSISRRTKLNIPVLESSTFVPNVSVLDIQQSVRVNMQIILENNLINKVKVIEVIDESTAKDAVPLTPIISFVYDEQLTAQVSTKILSKTPLDVTVDVENKSLTEETDCHLVIVSNILDRPEVLRQGFASLKENGFIMSRESKEYDISNNVHSNITIFTIHKTPTETLLLFRKYGEVKDFNYIKINSDNFTWISKVKRAIKQNGNQDIILYSINQPDCGILGLIKSLRKEPESKHVRCLFLLDETKQTDIKTYEAELKKNIAVNVFKGGHWGTYRYLPLEKPVLIESQHCFVNVTVRGDLSSLRWIEGPLRHNMTTRSGSELIHVHYAALNFKDVMVASGKINVDFEERRNQECVLGYEFSGRDNSGNRVCGITTQGALSSLVLTDPYSVFKIPDTWSLEEAASIPVVYITAIYCLIIVGHLKKDATILIHAGCGGVGQAAIRLALHYGCRVYTTVSSKAKRDFLKKTYPQLEDCHIGNSRDESFEQMIYRETNGRGVDMVLNSLSEDKLLASIRCLARGGKFIEIGKFDLANNNTLNLLLYKKEASFHGVMLAEWLTQSPHLKKEITELMIEGIKCGAVKPLKRRVFQVDEIEEAFRFMAAGKHMGKVLIQIRKSEDELSNQKFLGTARYFCDPEKTYVIVGGLGGIGLELADWLVLRGARKLVLTSRNGICTGYQHYRIRIWKSYGTIIKISKAIITTKAGCKELIEESLELGPVDAIFNLAMVLNDAVFENQTPQSFITAFEPKAIATKYLDELTRIMCSDLREFVVFSSIASGRGNSGQTNYAMANAVMEMICEKRKKNGYPALAVQWGPVGEVGILTKMYEERAEITIDGYLAQRVSSCLEVLDTLLKQKEATIVSSVIIAKKREINESDNIVDVVTTILGIFDTKSVSPHATLAELGLDSITAIEVKQKLEREYGIFFSLKEMRTMTLARLQDISKGEHGIAQFVQEFDFGQVFKLVSNELENYLPYIRLKSRVDEKSIAPKVLLFPGLEGFAKIFEPLTTKLDAHTICIRFRCNAEEYSIAHIVESIIPIVEQHLEKDEPFYIMAYSYGVLIALETVHVLESQGHIGTVICIDGAPLLMIEIIKKLNMESKQTIGINLMHYILLQSSLKINLKEMDDLLKSNTWEEKVNFGLEIARNCTGFNEDQLRATWNELYNRLTCVVNYIPTYKLKSNIKLYKPTNVIIKGLPDDYNLSHLSEQPVEVQVFDCDHSTILENTELAESISKYMGRRNHQSIT